MRNLRLFFALAILSLGSSLTFAQNRSRAEIVAKFSEAFGKIDYVSDEILLTPRISVREYDISTVTKKGNGYPFEKVANKNYSPGYEGRRVKYQSFDGGGVGAPTGQPSDRTYEDANGGHYSQTEYFERSSVIPSMHILPTETRVNFLRKEGDWVNEYTASIKLASTYRYEGPEDRSNKPARNKLWISVGGRGYTQGETKYRRELLSAGLSLKFRFTDDYVAAIYEFNSSFERPGSEAFIFFDSEGNAKKLIQLSYEKSIPAWFDAGFRFSTALGSGALLFDRKTESVDAELGACVDQAYENFIDFKQNFYDRVSSAIDREDISRREPRVADEISYFFSTAKLLKEGKASLELRIHDLRGLAGTDFFTKDSPERRAFLAYYGGLKPTLGKPRTMTHVTSPHVFYFGKGECLVLPTKDIYDEIPDYKAYIEKRIAGFDWVREQMGLGKK